MREKLKSSSLPQRPAASISSTPGPVTSQSDAANVSSATPLPVQAGRVALRRRFQKGTMITRGKTPTRCGIYREDVLQSDGTFKRVQRCVVLGPVSSLSERAAWKRFQPYLDRVNAAASLPPKSGMTLEEFVEEWRSNVSVNLKGSTTRLAESNLRAHIIPKLGSRPLTEINTKTVQGFVAYLAGGRSRKTVGKRSANSVFAPSHSKGVELCLREFLARGHNHAPRRREEGSAKFHG